IAPGSGRTAALMPRHFPAAAPPRQRQGTELDCRPGDALARLPQVQASRRVPGAQLR
ncbi:hypothetical protein G5642_28120, partial [Citrobacter freundii]|nr:hypothetical protein [Citrobacter freundii]